jgi:hypothetical protein
MVSRIAAMSTTRVFFASLLLAGYLGVAYAAVVRISANCDLSSARKTLPCVEAMTR